MRDLRELDLMPFSEIAAVLGLPERTVCNHFRVGMDKIKRTPALMAKLKRLKALADSKWELKRYASVE